MKALLSIVLLLAFGAYAYSEYTPEQIAQWKESAEKGEIWGQFNLGFAYANGNGVPEDYKEAVKWYRQAAEQGDANAQETLGDAYNRGNGVPQDDKEAVRWWKKAAEQGHPNAQFGLGSAYFFGRGVIEDKVQAYAWYNIAAANGDEGGKKFKTLVAEETTKEQIAEAQKLALEMIKANPKLLGD